MSVIAKCLIIKHKNHAGLNLNSDPLANYLELSFFHTNFFGFQNWIIVDVY